MRVYLVRFDEAAAVDGILMTELCGFPDYFPITAAKIPGFPPRELTRNFLILLTDFELLGAEKEKFPVFSRFDGNCLVQRTGAHRTSSMS
jgi:hypothetical protein